MDRRKIFVLLILAVCFGVPFCVTSSLLTARYIGQAHPGDQPGGTLVGTVLEGDEPLAGHTVKLVLVSGEERAVHATTQTARDGTFTFEAPAHKGYYEVRAGDGTYQRISRAVSFFDRGGQPTEPAEHVLELYAGCLLDIRLENTHGRPITGGTLYLEGRVGPSFPLNFLSATLVREEPFRGDRIEVGGLPSLHAKVRIELDSGDRVEFEQDLELGRTEKRVKL